MPEGDHRVKPALLEGGTEQGRRAVLLLADLDERNGMTTGGASASTLTATSDLLSPRGAM